VKLALPLLLFALLTGCAATGKDGTKHYLVLGLGVVSVNNTNPVGATVCKMQVLGIGVSDMPGVRFGVGYANSVVVAVPPTNHVLLEVSDGPFKPLIVNTP
jgi:hypothetical protein